MKKKIAWIGFSGLVTAALITGIFLKWANNKSDPAKQSVTQSSGIGNNENAGRDINHANGDILQAAGNLTVTKIYGDTVKPKRPAGGSVTYNVTSNHQHGGITAANVWVFKNATIIAQAPTTTSTTNMATDYNFTVDTSSQTIRVQPRNGTWNIPFIGFPPSERVVVAPHVAMQNNTTFTLTSAVYHLSGDSLFGLVSNVPSTSQLYYSLHYDALPSRVVFGNFPAGPLFEVRIKAGEAVSTR